MSNLYTYNKKLSKHCIKFSDITDRKYVLLITKTTK